MVVSRGVPFNFNMSDELLVYQCFVPGDCTGTLSCNILRMDHVILKDSSTLLMPCDTITMVWSYRSRESAFRPHEAVRSSRRRFTQHHTLCKS